jgi:hypothetical protein
VTTINSGVWPVYLKIKTEAKSFSPMNHPRRHPKNHWRVKINFPNLAMILSPVQASARPLGLRA